MTFYEARLSLQLEAEERIGAAERGTATQARMTEDAAVAAIRQSIEGGP